MSDFLRNIENITRELKLKNSPWTQRIDHDMKFYRFAYPFVKSSEELEKSTREILAIVTNLGFTKDSSLSGEMRDLWNLVRKILLKSNIPSASKIGWSALEGTAKIRTLKKDKKIKFIWSLDKNSDSLLSRYLRSIDKSFNVVDIDISIIQQSDLHLSSWLSLMANDELAVKMASQDEINMLKGLPYRTFCYILGFIKTMWNELPEIVTLDAVPIHGAAGRTKEKDAWNLIKYYKSLGFNVVNSNGEDDEKKILEDEGRLEMNAAFNHITNICESRGGNRGIDLRKVNITVNGKELRTLGTY